MQNSNLPKIVAVVFVLLAGVLLAFAWPSAIAANSQAIVDSNRAPVGTGFTYQGHLELDGSPADGDYDFEFALYDQEIDGTQVGFTVTLDNVSINEGFFSVELDFGNSAFGGGERWLQITVRPGDSAGAFTQLDPRQEITPAPYALTLPNVYTDEAVNFVGIGRNFRISGNEVFGVRYTGSPNQYGGMYVETSDSGGWPFYGYATNGSFRAWTYYNGTTGDWSLYNAGIRLKCPLRAGCASARP